MSRSYVLLALAVACVTAQTTNAPDPCAQYPTCQDCISHNLCGWCSEPVVYPGNVTGKQCAGFNPNGPDPFACNGIYSTDQCFSGYFCNTQTWTCDLAPPGDGVPLATCESNCSNNGDVYLCNTTTKKCYVVPPGTSGASSLSVCEASCQHPSPHPVPPPPPPSPAPVYACNYTTGQCNPAPAGKGTSKAVCEQECSKENGQRYICNSFLQKCVKVPKDFPHATSLAKCEEECTPHPQPGPPPGWLGGMWRGISVGVGYKMGEWDVKVTQTTFTMIDVASATTWKGIPFHVSHGNNVELWVNITAGPGAGQVMKAIQESDNRGPETNFMSAAFSQPGGAAPTSIQAAWTNSAFTVLALAQCAGTPECIFTMPSTGKSFQKRLQAALKLRGGRSNGALPSSAHGFDHSVMGMPKKQLLKKDAATPNHFGSRRLLSIAEIDGPNSDPCSQYGSSCQTCLSHALCGWCSENVTYKGGVQGTQCAGFASNPNQTNPFVCRGRYSTLSCTTGYDCTSTGQCVPDPNPGNGMPLNVCQEICKLTTTPAPVPQWVCNVTSKQCYHCNQSFCPGSMPKATCEASCVKPKPGPTSLTKGLWRGIKIENNYPLGEYDLWFNASAVTFYKGSNVEWSGTLESFGGDVVQIQVLTGTLAGKTLSAIYSVADQGSALFEWGTFAFGAPDGQVPQSYAVPMQTPPEFELVMAKCLQPPCVFQRP